MSSLVIPPQICGDTDAAVRLDNQIESGPCAGVRVLELGTSMVSGPFCGQILGDLAADVIKLESPGGELMRFVPPIQGEFSGQFLQFNRNKRSIAVDLKSAEGRDIARALIAKADVLIENFRPGVTSRLGLDHAQTRSLNERLVYVSINGFGADGPYAKLPAYDQVIQGLTGFMRIQGDDAMPAAVRSVIVDKVTALSAATSVLAALLERSRTGKGQHVEVKMLNAFAAFMLPEFMAAHAFVEAPPAALPSNAIYRTLRTADGHLVGLVVQDSQFVGMCKALGRPDLVNDERFSTAAKRFAAMDELLGALEEKTRTMTTREVLDVLWANSEVAIAPVNSLSDFLQDPQVRHSRAVVTVDDPKAGPIRMLGPLARFGGASLDRLTRAPTIGEHTDEILSELSLGQGEIQRLRAKGKIK